MAKKSIKVRSHKRKLKSGRIVNVKQFSQNRDVLDALLGNGSGRPPTAAQQGTFANGRSVPDSPKVAKARARVATAKVRAAKKQLDARRSASPPTAKKAAVPVAKKAAAPRPSSLAEAQERLRAQADARSRPIGAGAAFDVKDGSWIKDDNGRIRKVAKVSAQGKARSVEFEGGGSKTWDDDTAEVEFFRARGNVADPSDFRPKGVKSGSEIAQGDWVQRSGETLPHPVATATIDKGNVKVVFADNAGIANFKATDEVPIFIPPPPAVVEALGEKDRLERRRNQLQKIRADLATEQAAEQDPEEKEFLSFEIGDLDTDIADMDTQIQAAESRVAAAKSSIATPPPAPGTDPLGRPLPPLINGIPRGAYDEFSLSQSEKNQYIADLQNTIDKILSTDGDSQAQNAVFVGGDAVYSPERLALHKQIAQTILDKAEADGVPREGQAIISGGLPGAGKTYLLKTGGYDTDKYVTINPDDFKSMIAAVSTVPGTEDGKYGPLEMAAILHEESSDLSKMVRDLVLEAGFNVILDVTLGGKGEKSRNKHRTTVEMLRAKGYSVDGVFADIPLEMSAESASGRYWRGWAERMNGKSWEGGRYVPASVAADHTSDSGYNSSNRDNFDGLKDLLRDYRVMDNSDRDAGPKLKEEGGNKTDTQVDDPFVKQAFDPFQDPIARLNAVIEQRRQRWYSVVGRKDGD